jgi:hypothetical protein
MKKHEFNTSIDAPREKVWDVLWNDATYRQWTAPFSAGSHAVTDWKKGSKVLFLDGRGHGMVSRIEENIPNEFMSIEHLGEVKDGVEDTQSEAVKAWAGAHENYTLRDNNGKTELTVEMDITDDFAEMFNNIFPKALAKVKELSEKQD